MKKFLTVKDITLMAVLTAVLFVQEEALSFLPNIQLTVFLLVLYSIKLGPYKTSVIILLHAILDNLVMGSFNLIYMPAMLAGWLIIPITLSTCFKAVRTNIPLAFLGIFYSLLYSWIYIIPGTFAYNIDFITYLYSDIIFEIFLSLSSFLSILLLYNPMSELFDRYI